MSTDNFGSAFAPDRKFIKAALARVARGIDMAPSVWAALCKRLEPAIISGDPRAEARAARVLDGQPWRWPWFESCARDFDAAGVWPRGWHAEGIVPPLAWETVGEALRRDLLLRTVAFSTYAERDAANLQDPSIRIVFRPTLRAEDDCSASRLVSKMHLMQIEAGDFAELPPYFPADPTTLDSILRRRQ